MPECKGSRSLAIISKRDENLMKKQVKNSALCRMQNTPLVKGKMFQSIYHTQLSIKALRDRKNLRCR